MSHDALLNPLFQARVPGGRLQLQCLPDGLPIRLWLADPAMFNTRFDDQVVNAIMESPPYWSFCWASGQVLARRILANPTWVAGKRVLDFGCGSGVVAIAAALAGAREAIACDLDSDALCAAGANATQNGVAVTPLADVLALVGEADLLFAADILYDPDNHAVLPLLRQRAREVWLADSRVKHFAAEGFIPVARDQATSFPDMGEWEGYNQVNLYRASR